VARVEERLAAAPRIDLLVNNAGIGTFGAIRSLPIAGELREIDLNIRALVRLAHAAVRIMTANGSGTVLNMSSILALQTSPGSVTYAATKDRLDAIPTFMQLTPDQAVKSSLRATQKGKAISIPAFGYSLAAAIIGVTPRRFVRWFSGVTARLMDQHQTILAWIETARETRSRPTRNGNREGRQYRGRCSWHLGRAEGRHTGSCPGRDRHRGTIGCP
jgi:short-subunit dehydrogenase